MKRTFLKFLCMTFLAGFFITSCATARPMEKVLPRETALYIHMENPDLFFAETESFLTAAGLDALLGASSLKAKVQEFTEGDFFPQGSIDYSRPAGLGMIPYPGNPGGDNFAMVFFLPVTDSFSLKELKEKDSGPDSNHYRQVKSYLIIASEEGLLEDLPAKSRIDLGRLNSYPPGAANFYMNLEQLLVMLDLDMEELLAAEYPDGPGSELINPLMAGYAGLLKQIGPFWLSLRADSAELTSVIDLDLKGEFGDILGGMNPPKGLKDFSAYLMEDANLYQSVSSIHPEDRQKFSQAILNCFPLEKTELGALLSSLQLSGAEVSLEGARTASSGNIHFTGPPMNFLSEDPLSSLKDAFAGFTYENLDVSEITDPRAYTADMERNMGVYLETINNMLSSFTKEMGIIFEMYQEEKTDPRGRPYWKVGYAVLADPASSPAAEADQEFLAIFNWLMENSNVYFMVKDNVVFTYSNISGSSQEARFLELVNSLPGNAGVPGWLSGVPETAHEAGKLNMGGLIDSLVSLFLPREMVAAMLPREPGDFRYYIEYSGRVSAVLQVSTEQFRWLNQYFQFIKNISSFFPTRSNDEV